MRILWMETKYIKSAARLLNINWVNKRGLDLSKEVLWVSFGQRGAKLPAVKVGGLKKNLAIRPGAGYSGSRPAAWQNFFSNFQLWQLAALLPFDLQRPTVHLWKDIDPNSNISNIVYPVKVAPFTWGLFSNRLKSLNHDCTFNSLI